MRLPEKGQAAAPTPNDRDPRDEAGGRSHRPRQPHRLPGGRQRKGRSDGLGAGRGRRLRRAARRGDAVGHERLAHGQRAGGASTPRPRAAPPQAGDRPADARAAGRARRRRARRAADPAPSPVLAAPPQARGDAGRPTLTPRRPWCSMSSALPLPAAGAAPGDAAPRAASDQRRLGERLRQPHRRGRRRRRHRHQQLRSEDHGHPGHDDPGGARDRDQHRRARLRPRGRQPGRAQLRRQPHPGAAQLAA